MPNLPLHLPFIFALALAVLLPATHTFGQEATCPKVSTRTATPADTAYAEGIYPNAEELYTQQIVQQPHDAELTAGLIRTLLHEGKIPKAIATLDAVLPGSPDSVPLLTAEAEVQLRQGQPWLAAQSLQTIATSNPCYARAHLIRSRIFRIDSMYSSERKEIQSAYDIDPTDPEIRRAWVRTVSPTNDILSIQQSLSSTNEMTPEVKTMAEASARSMLSLLSENSQTCQILPTIPSATLPLLPSMRDGKNIDAYRLEVQFPQTKSTLQVDTAASGLYISRALADANGLKSNDSTPSGTVHADRIQVGPFEFRDCTVGVSETPFAGNGDGFIGMDLFAPYLITLDYTHAKLTLAPLPPQASSLPGDRSDAAELRGFSPVYHRQHYLLVPVLLNNKERRLFVLDSGIRFSTMTSEVAHSVSSTKMNFTNAVQTTSGATIQVYRDNFNLEFANLLIPHQPHMLEMNTSAVERTTGLQIGGMLGFDLLHSMTIHLDYRDGLVRFESMDPQVSAAETSTSSTAGVASAAPASQPICQHLEDTVHPISSTIEARTTGFWDSRHLKAGSSISVQVIQGWTSPGCTLSPNAILYGHVMASTFSKTSGDAQFALTFDHGDCDGQGKKQLAISTLGLLAPPGEFQGLHNALPTELGRGSTRQISDVASAMGTANDQNLNPGGAPGTIRPGAVLGIPKLKLQPEAGPGCSTLLTTPNQSVQLGQGTQFVMMLQATP
ncbi:tetratricopeptide repeat protein [Granulicella arctica]|uniref:tetratricopeptide repeat protein n=1 Tax=Granulicella arctica TaxID=940613 RepID=UPI0021E06773|nr:aspartyl protease family protein [Granulicella arctica]